MIYAAGAVVLIYMFLTAFVVCWEMCDFEASQIEKDDDEKQES